MFRVFVIIAMFIIAALVSGCGEPSFAATTPRATQDAATLRAAPFTPSIRIHVRPRDGFTVTGVSIEEFVPGMATYGYRSWRGARATHSNTPSARLETSETRIAFAVRIRSVNSAGDSSEQLIGGTSGNEAARHRMEEQLRENLLIEHCTERACRPIEAHVENTWRDVSFRECLPTYDQLALIIADIN